MYFLEANDLFAPRILTLTWGSGAHPGQSGAPPRKPGYQTQSFNGQSCAHHQCTKSCMTTSFKNIRYCALMAIQSPELIV